MTEKLSEEERRKRWTRIDGFVEPWQHRLIKEIAHREDISMAEVLRVYINIASAVLVGDIQEAIHLAELFKNTPKEVIREYSG
jgi:hypothetical protein